MDIPNLIDKAEQQVQRLIIPTHLYSWKNSQGAGWPAGRCGSLAQNEKVHSWHEIKRNAITCRECLELFISDNK